MSGVVMESERGEEYRGTMINFEQTELRLGLPGGGGGSDDGEILAGKSGSAKRGFLETVDLKLNLSSSMGTVKEEATKLEHKTSAKPPSK